MKKIFILILIIFLNNFNLISSFSEEAQIERGSPNIILDSLGNIISLPKKIILLNPKVDSHSISPATEEMIMQYIKDNPGLMKDTKVRLNQFSLFGDLKRLTENKKISWYWRIFPGIPVTVFSSGLGRLLGGDHYNPYSDTINIYSDIPAVALHEAGHAVDMTEKVKEGWADYYTIGRTLVPVTLHQEYVASEEAIDYLKEKGDREEENNAYKTLIPAYGTYVGGNTGLPYGDAIGAAAGHVVSIVPRYNSRLGYQALDNAKWSNEAVRDIRSDPVAKNLIEENETREAELNKVVLKEENDSQIRFDGAH